MERTKSQCREPLEIFQKKHPDLFQQPIIQSFLQDEKNRELVRQAICYPTRQNRQLVDEAFQTFYSHVRALTYLTHVIHSQAIHFDKTMQKHNSREILTLDQPLQSEEDGQETTHKDMLYQPSSDMADKIACETMGDYVDDPSLYQAIQSLTAKQRDILTYRYGHQLSNKEIADWFGDSLQNVSKLHRKALQHLKKYLTKDSDRDDDN